MIAGSSFVNIFGAVPGGAVEQTENIAVAAVRAGFAVVLCQPGTKVPLCILTARAAAAADKAARLEAREAGVPGWERKRHACGIAHAITQDVPDPRIRTMVRSVIKRHGGANIGIELGRSRHVVVDIDTPEEHTAFLNTWSAETGIEQDNRHVTVRSPGSRKDDEWVHHGGGHYWFSVPDGIELPTDGGVLKADGGWTVMWAGKQVLVPPSTRPEGAYEVLTQPEVLPDWLAMRITLHAEGRRERMLRAVDKMLDDEDPIEVWSARTPWADLLDGWIDTGLVDTCSCPIWTAPGSHASPKSATAHDLGCIKFNTDTGWGPLHIWTDNPPEFLVGKNTWTKLAYVAARDYDGDMRAAMHNLGLSKIAPSIDLFDPRESGDDKDPFVAASTDEVEDNVDEEENLFGDIDCNDLDDLPDSVPLITDVIDQGAVTIVAGKFGTYKTFLALAWAYAVATGTAWAGHTVPEAAPVMYIYAEGHRGIRKRLAAIRRAEGVTVPRDMLRVYPKPVRLLDGKSVRALDARMKQHGTKLLVLDTLSRCAFGADENNNGKDGMAGALEIALQLRDRHDCAVLVLHHTGHPGERARGASAIEDNADASYVIKLGNDGEDRGPSNPRVLHHRKAKDAELIEAVTLSFVSVPGTDSGYLSTDPFSTASAQPATKAARWAQSFAVALAAGVTPASARTAVRGVLKAAHAPGFRSDEWAEWQAEFAAFCAAEALKVSGE